LLVVVALVGAVGRVYRPASATLLSRLTPKHRQVMIFAMYRLALNLGTTAAPLIGIALISVSYNLLFWGEAAAALGYAVIAAIALPRHGVQAEPGEVSAKPAGKKRAAGGFLAMMADGRYVLFLVAMLVNSVVYIQYVTILPLAMRAAGLATVWYGAVVALNGVIVITCELLMTKLTQRRAPRIVAAVGFTLLGGGMASYVLPWGAAIFVIGTLVWSLAEIVAGPTLFAYPAMAAPPRVRGRYVGAAQGRFGLGMAIGPVIGVAVWHSFGRSLWWTCGLACAVGLAAAWRGIGPQARAPEADPGLEPDTRQPAQAAPVPPPARAPRQAPRPASGRGRPVRRGPRCELDRVDLDLPLHVLDPPVVRGDGLLIHRGENDPPKVGVDVLTGGHQVAGASREVLGVESGERVDAGEY